MPRDRRNLSRQVAVIGVAESDEIGVVPRKTAIQLLGEAAWNAMEDAGVKKEEVDALFSAGPGGPPLGEYFGLVPRYADGTSLGGPSSILHIGQAVMAIASGLCEMALIVHGESGRSQVGVGAGVGGNGEWDGWQGMAGPWQSQSLACVRHMYQYGTTHDDLAEIAVATRKWARLNPKAMMRDPMTFEDYHNSRWLSYPFHLWDCCLLTDAAGAVILTAAEWAQNYKRKPIYVLGFGEALGHGSVDQMLDLTVSAAKSSGPRAFQMAGVEHQDLRVVNIEDSSTYAVGVSLESLGFCGPGEFGDFIRGQRTAPGGELPMNTNGGGLSYTHPGLYGIFTIIETVRQLRGEGGPRQVANATLGLAHLTGGTLSSAATLILSNS